MTKSSAASSLASRSPSTKAALKQAAIQAAQSKAKESLAGSFPKDPVLSGLSTSRAGAGDPQEFFVHMVNASPMDRVLAVKKGLNYRVLHLVANEMGTMANSLASSLGIGRATLARKKQERSLLGKEHSERLIGIASLIGQVQLIMKEQSDQPDFDAAKWFRKWSEEPVPALGGRKPEEFLDTMEGQRIVSNILSAMRAGTYL